MDIALEAILNHANDITKFETLEEYDSHIDYNGMKKSVKLPAFLLHFMRVRIVKDRPYINFHGLVITQSASFDRKVNRKNGLTLASELFNHFINYPGFTYSRAGTDYDFQINTDTITMNTLFTDERFVIHGFNIDVQYI